jgi:hypothetical protein
MRAALNRSSGRTRVGNVDTLYSQRFRGVRNCRAASTPSDSFIAGIKRLPITVTVAEQGNEGIRQASCSTQRDWWRPNATP